jgi:hypothetical protein
VRRPQIDSLLEQPGLDIGLSKICKGGLPVWWNVSLLHTTPGRTGFLEELDLAPAILIALGNRVQDDGVHRVRVWVFDKLRGLRHGAGLEAQRHRCNWRDQ